MLSQPLITNIQRPGDTASAKTTRLDVEGLAQDLRETIEGEVRFDNGSRALYAAGGANYRQVPIGVVIPKSVDDIIRTVAACRRYGAPLLSRGGGTSLAGQICNVAVVMDMSKYSITFSSLIQHLNAPVFSPASCWTIYAVQLKRTT